MKLRRAAAQAAQTNRARQQARRAGQVMTRQTREAMIHLLHLEI